MRTNIIKNAFSTALVEGKFIRIEFDNPLKIGYTFCLSSFTGKDKEFYLSFSNVILPISFSDVIPDKSYHQLMTVNYFGDMAVDALIEYMYKYCSKCGISESELDTIIEENEYIIKYNMIYKRKNRSQVKQIICGTEEPEYDNTPNIKFPTADDFLDKDSIEKIKILRPEDEF